MDNSRKFSAAKTEKVMREVDWQGCIDIIGHDGSRNQKQTLANAAEKLGVKERLLRTLYSQETSEPKYRFGCAIIEQTKAQADRYESIAASLEATDADKFREDIERYRKLAQRARALAW